MIVLLNYDYVQTGTHWISIDAINVPDDINILNASSMEW